MKKLGFGLMRLPLMDADDPKKIDREAVCRMVDCLWNRDLAISIPPTLIMRG